MIYRHFGDFMESLGAYGERPALTIQPFLKIERLSYAGLQVRAHQAAHYLTARGVKRGDRVLVVATNSPQWVVLFFGAQLLSATVVPVDVGSTPAATLTFAEQVTPKLVFRDKHAHQELDKHYATELLEDLYTLLADFPETALTAQPKGDDIAVIVFTSGTTADPKGVVLTQRNILANVEGVQQALAIDADWRLLSVLPLSHMYELTGGCLAVLSRGASVFYLPRVTPAAIARGLQEYQITTLLAIPQLLILLSERVKQGAAEAGKAKVLAMLLVLAGRLPFASRRLLFSSVHKRFGGHLKLVVTGGAPIPVDVARMWERMGVKALEGYGLTETAPVLTVNSLKRRRLSSSGQPLSNVQLRIAEDGEIQAQGPNVFAGYWHNSEASKAVFTKDGWFRTGDVGRLRDGWLYIQGRLKFAIVLSSGLKVFPEDIEVVAAAQPAIKALCVVGVKRAEGEVAQAVIISDLTDSGIDQIIAKINGQLASFQHISEWRRWPADDFPRTRLLKVDRRKVQQWANDGPAKQPVAANPHMHDPLVQIIRVSLDDPDARIKESDRLADVGLDSLRRLNVVTLIEEQMGVTIAEATVTPQTTLADLRKLIAAGQPATPPQRRPSWPYKPWVRPLGNALRDSFLWAIVGIWVQVRVDGRDQLDSLDGPALFIFNHVDNFDGPVVYRALPRKVRKRLTAAVLDEFMRNHAAFAFIVRFGYGGFNFARTEPYMPSLTYVSRMVDHGWHVALSPEGRISKSGELQPFKSGIGLLAVELGIPVVPVKTFGLFGTLPLHGRWPRHRSRVTVRIGQPVSFDRHQDYDEVTRQLRQLMEDL